MDRSRIVDCVTCSPAETVAFGRALGEKMDEGTIACFFGDLGAGKTTLIQGLASGLTQDPALVVSSPTFVYLNIYSGVRTVYHFDLYRLNSELDFIGMGFDDFFTDGGIVCIEWSERIASILPPKRVEITLEHCGEEKRAIEVKWS